nr:MAG TPA: helix-turn-helix domain protein [Caudoviricetes sp.]
MYTLGELQKKGEINMYNMKKNGERLLALRGSLSREKVAADNGISASALTMYELGLRNPRDEVKISLAQYYKTSVEAIFFAQ